MHQQGVHRAVVVIVGLAPVWTAIAVFECVLDAVHLVAQPIGGVEPVGGVGAQHVKILIIGAGEITHCLALSRRLPPPGRGPPSRWWRRRVKNSLASEAEADVAAKRRRCQGP